jgi:hypothetical protein
VQDAQHDLTFTMCNSYKIFYARGRWVVGRDHVKATDANIPTFRATTCDPQSAHASPSRGELGGDYAGEIGAWSCCERGSPAKSRWSSTTAAGAARPARRKVLFEIVRASRQSV